MKLKKRCSQIIYSKIKLCLKKFFVYKVKRKPSVVWTTRRKEKYLYFWIKYLLHSADNSIIHWATAFTDGVQGHLDNISTYIIMSSQCCARRSWWPQKREDSCSATYISVLVAFLMQPDTLSVCLDVLMASRTKGPAGFWTGRISTPRLKNKRPCP